ncbi:MAG: histidinol-phosphate transaminase [Candidatus Limnocylindrales bacterium]
MTSPLESFVRPGLATAAPYNASHHDFAWQHRELARMMSNECPLPPSGAVVRAVTEAIAVSNLYPYSGEDLREALANYAGVARESLMLGNGSTEVIDVLVRTLVGPGDETIIPTPTYAFFESQTRLSGGTPIFVPLTASWGLDVAGILRAVTARTKVIFLCSPNNPTGNSWSSDEVGAVLAAGVPTIIDQAYLECGYAESFAPLVAAHRNLIVARTMSKGFGLASLRIGYAIADPWLIDVLHRVRIPFSLSLMSLWGGLAAVNEPQELERRRVLISTERERLFGRLQDMPGVVAYPSQGNFILADISGSGRTAPELVAALRASDILIRAMRAHRLEGSHVRVTIGTREQNDRFLDLLPVALGLEGSSLSIPA